MTTIISWGPRYVVLGVVCCATALCYLDRMVIATVIPFIARDLRLSSVEMGAVLSAFFVGYALMQIPGGLLSDRFGPRIVLTSSILWFSAMSSLTGCALGLSSMLLVRFLFGVGEGPFPPGVAKSIASWFPPGEVARATGLQQAATYVGATVAPLFAVALASQFGWRVVFFASVLPGLLVAWLIRRVAVNPPEARTPGLATEKSQSAASDVERTRATVLQALRNPGVRWCALCLLLWNIASWGLLNWLPTYLLQARGFDASKMAVFASITNLSGGLGLAVGGFICDGYFGSKLRIPVVASLLSGALFTYLAAVAPTGEWAVTHLMVVSFTSGIGSTALFALPLVLVSKDAVGAAFGVVNTAGQIAGVLSPLIVGYLLRIAHGDFQPVLYCMVVVTLLAVYPSLRIRQCQSARPKGSAAVGV